MSRIGSPESRLPIASLTWWGISFAGRPPSSRPVPWHGCGLHVNE